MLVERGSKVFFGHPAVDPLDHARIGMAHRYADEVRRHSVKAEPGPEGPPEVVWADGGDARALTRLG